MKLKQVLIFFGVSLCLLLASCDGMDILESKESLSITEARACVDSETLTSTEDTQSSPSESQSTIEKVQITTGESNETTVKPTTDANTNNTSPGNNWTQNY